MLLGFIDGSRNMILSFNLDNELFNIKNNIFSSPRPNQRLAFSGLLCKLSPSGKTTHSMLGFTQTRQMLRAILKNNTKSRVSSRGYRQIGDDRHHVRSICGEQKNPSTLYRGMKSHGMNTEPARNLDNLSCHHTTMAIGFI
uniref:Uncharacterized protein n=1 Tax=Triticum urartu TaxID=4572 RepID=A0A8R7V908_TRIUA